MCENMSDVFRKTPVIKIMKHPSMYQLYTHDRVYEAKNIILNTTVYDTPKLFEDKEITAFYKKYEKLDNHQSSFMLYATIKTDKKLHHHYQLIQKEIIKRTLSKALFVSFSDQEDNEIAPHGYYSMTASIHTDTRFWDVNKEVYSRQKEQLQAILLEIIMRSFDLDADEVIKCFSATPKTFARYIRRSQLGGNAMSMKNFLPLLPSNDTPIEGLYHVGDSVYAAQGWPGVMFGVKNLTKLLDV
jgi:phytoene dehydrogenase-like protein